MFKFATIVSVLLSASCLLCKQGSSLSWPGLNPLKALDEHLIANAHSDDFKDNMLVLQELVKSQDFAKNKNDAFKQLSTLVLKLTNNNNNNLDDNNSLCSAENIATIKEVAQAVKSYDKHAFEESRKGRQGRRLVDLLHSYATLAGSRCFEELQSEWTREGAGPEQQLDGATGEALKRFDLINRGAVSSIRGRNSDEICVELLANALERTSTVAAAGRGQKLKYFSGTELKQLVDNNNQLTGHESRATLSRLINERLIKPCESLIGMKQASTILKPIVDLSSSGAIKFDQLVDEQQHGHFDSFGWASRYISCEQLFRMDTEKLIDAMANDH